MTVAEKHVGTAPVQVAAPGRSERLVPAVYQRIGKIIALDTPRKLIKDLLAKGFKKPQIVEQANLEDVYIDLTGRALRD